MMVCMTYIKLPEEDKTRRLVFYLAMEEYVAANLDKLLPHRTEKEAFFMWQVPPTVIFGRNQVMEAEVNIDYCRSKGINLYRRKSGGGCVYSDWGNIMLSYITDKTDVAFTFESFLQRIALVLRRAGLPACVSGRNDIMVDGKKVSGNAFFLKPKSSIVHGTMLFDTDFEELTKAITPSEAKIKSKGVDSVRAHVTNLRPYFIASHKQWQQALSDISKFKSFIAANLCTIASETEEDSTIFDQIILNDTDLEEIQKIEAAYLDPDFLQGKKHNWSKSLSCKIENVGEIEVRYEMEADHIIGCTLTGDFFPLKEGIGEYLSSALNGCRDDFQEVSHALASCDLAQFISGLDAVELARGLYGITTNQ